MEFKQILEKYRKISFSERDKGDRFERLMKSYLLSDPQYSTTLKHVWMWNEFPSRKDFGGQDIGIDLVAETEEGEYWAIQCKCYQEKSQINKKEVDSFLSASSKQFQHEQTLSTVAFSHRLWISTTNRWGATAEETIKNQNPPVSRLNQHELARAPVSWKEIEQGVTGRPARLKRKKLRDHQKEAVEKTSSYFKEHDRGKLIMACGTGKTFTSLKIAEKETNGSGFILFLVPSIALLGQTLREWSAEAEEDISPIAICSDPKSTRKIQNDDADSTSVTDLAFPASTKVDTIIHQLYLLEKSHNAGLKVVFSTYQSIDVIAEAQKRYIPLSQGSRLREFDLIICDEAHRTTGVALTKEDSSAFIKVHDNNFIRAKKRLYMTATPRLYSEGSKAKAAMSDAILCSMDDEPYYGKEIYRIGFGESVEKNLLSDYKVLILTLSEGDVPESIQNMIVNEEQEINADDAAKLIGCINALSKQILGDEGTIKAADPNPMQRALAFCQTIKISKHITNIFNSTAGVYIDSLAREKQQTVSLIESKHIDGTMSAPERDNLLGWLKSDTGNECKILTNVRCLSEGIDVPSLDAVLFLSARNSQIDVVQSVGRVMRKAAGKKYGYIIIPVLVPSHAEPSKALDDNKRYKVVWSVLNALRAHDDRFNATINKIDLNKKHPNSIIVGTIGGADTRENETDAGKNTYNNEAQQFSLRFEELQSVVYAKLVQKVGDRRYWEQWATSVAEIAERQIKRITQLVEKDGEHQKTFEEFLHGLQTNINPSVSKREAIEMLSQHSITKPVFEALFENYSFVQNNPVSVSIQNMITLLEQQTIENDTRSLNIFYESVRKRAAGIDNSEGKQRIIIELYDKFFKTAFPKLVEKLGIVYTPVEVVDFIIHSVNDILQQEFGRTLSDKNINIIDPFTGTGTFIVRLLQSGLITPEDLPRKYSTEIFANEIVLLAYYIASVNIENAYHDISSHSQYTRFNGICLADTFQLYESSSEKQFSSMFPENTERVVKQKQSRIQVIIGNPPYSVGQRSGNDNARNQSYPLLEEKIKNTYVKRSSTGLSKSSYDSYIKAFRWAADRIDSEEGIICFVSNGNWIEAKSQDGFRACIQDEFSKVYVFNLRGNIRADIGSSSRKEGGNIFGSQSMTQISITLLVKKKEKTTCDIYYHDIGDYLSRKEKLETIKNFKTISNIQYEKLSPNERGDWIKQGDELFNKFIPLWPQKKFDLSCKSFFNTHAIGVSSNRDSWVYNFSREKLKNNVGSFIDFYNRQRKKYHEHLRSSGHADINSVIDRDERKIKWTRSLKNKLIKNFEIIRDESSIIVSAYRPFSKQYLYYHHPIIECPGVMKRFFPAPDINNMVISLSGMSKNRFSLLMTNTITDLHCTGDSQIFPLYYFEETTQKNQGLFDTVIGNTAWTKKSAVSDYIHSIAVKLYGKSVTKEDIFFYVYGLLHSRHYQQKFAHDLRQSLPKLPLLESVKDFRQFSQKGRELADIHINYENEGKHPDIEIDGLENRNFTVRKMKFANPQHTDTIIVNNSITIRNIPPRAYDYTVNGKSAIKLVMEQYQAGIDRKSGMSNDPNDWAQEMRNPRYIVNLLISIITVSIKSVDIINSLPAPQWGEM